MSSWFSNVDIDDIPDNPNELPNNTYKFQVISAVVKPTKGGDKVGITFKYQIIEGSYSNFFPISDWVQVPSDDTKKDDVARMLSYLKMRLLSWGFTPDEIQEFGPGDEQKCVNRTFWGTTSLKKDKDNSQIRVVKFDPVEDGTDSMVDFPEM